MFIILLIFIYEFSNRIKYITNPVQSSIEKFEDRSIKTMTYLPNGFSQGYLNNLNVKEVSKDLGVKRSINQVKPATQEDPPSEFFTPLDINLFRKDLPKWTLKQRPWQESFTFLDDIVEQKDKQRDFKNKNMDSISIWEKMILEKRMLEAGDSTPSSSLTPFPSSTPTSTPSTTPSSTPYPTSTSTPVSNRTPLGEFYSYDIFF